MSDQNKSSKTVSAKSILVACKIAIEDGDAEAAKGLLESLYLLVPDEMAEGSTAPSSDTRLLPCPFCGSESARGAGDDGISWVECMHCDADGPLCNAEETAYELWNKRASQSETSGDTAVATTAALLRTFERALVSIDAYSPASTVQPVQIARDALRAAYGPHYRSAARVPQDETGDVARLHAAIQAVMARLADLLDADQFNNIEAIVLEAGVPYPPQVKASVPSGPGSGTCARCGTKIEVGWVLCSWCVERDEVTRISPP